MNRILALVAGTVALALIVAACGARSSAAPAPSPIRTTVATRQVPGLGTILTNESGMALYVNDQDRSGMAACKGACTADWLPLSVAGTPTGSGVDGRLGVIRRADGARQVTLDGRPVYSFVFDHVGTVRGNGFHDQFASQKFSWHVMLANGTTPAATTAPSAGASGGSSVGSSGGFQY
jgi:predicted lipoprotein with Yx(FWY)xxD motif